MSYGGRDGGEWKGRGRQGPIRQVIPGDCRGNVGSLGLAMKELKPFEWSLKPKTTVLVSHLSTTRRLGYIIA